MSKIKNLIPNKAAIKKNGPVMAGAALGGVATGFLNSQLPKILPAAWQSPKMMAAAPLLVGVILGCNKNPMLQGVGLGIIGVSSQGLAHQFGIGDAFLGDVPQYIEIEGVDTPAGSDVMLGNAGAELGY